MPHGGHHHRGVTHRFGSSSTQLDRVVERIGIHAVRRARSRSRRVGCRCRLDGARGATETFCKAIIDATADLACAFKLQIAYFASQGGGAGALERICRYVRETYPDVTLMLDAKRGDIGSTAEVRPPALGRYGAQPMTVNPYLGTDSAACCTSSTAVASSRSCRTSNPGGDDIQSLVADGSHRSTPHVAGWSPIDGRLAATAASSSAPRTRPNWPTSERSHRMSRSSFPASALRAATPARSSSTGPPPTGVD